MALDFDIQPMSHLLSYALQIRMLHMLINYCYL
jgi:hypothetical protein